MNLNGVTDVKGFYNIAGRPLRRWTSYMSSPTTTTKLQNWWRPPQLQPQNFGTGANGRYYKDSARIPEVCLREELWLPSKLQQYMNSELPDVQAGLGKGRGTRDQIANICWIIKKSKSPRKISISALLTMPKPLTVWITINCGKFSKRWEYQTTWPASWETCIQVRKQQLELDMEQQTGSK